jgi:hydrogenase maturation protease
MRNVLVIGYGNPGRLDDGLGPALARTIEERQLPGVSVDADYQLLVEDAADVAKHDVAVFADASTSGREPFSFFAIEPKPPMSFSSHSVEPSAVMALARDMFQAPTRAYALAIRGYEFNEFGERLSERASANLQEAARFLEDVIRRGAFEDAVEAAG